MLALSLLLTAAAGVHAMVGQEVSAVKISEESYICADNCAYEGVYFSQKGYYCPEKEVIFTVRSFNNYNLLTHDCIGAKLDKGFSQRQPSNGEKLPSCDMMELRDYEELGCPSNRDSGGKARKLVQWSDVEKELKSATTEGGKGTPEENQPAAPKSQQQCFQIGRDKFMECRESSDDFNKCDEQAREVIRNCLGQA